MKLKYFGLYTAMVDALASKTTAWELERGIEFTYDGVSKQFISVNPLKSR